MRKFDETCKESLSTAELSEMLVDYAQINERLEAENKRLREEVETLRSYRSFMRETQTKENKRLQAKCELLSLKCLELMGCNFPPPSRQYIEFRDKNLLLHVFTPVNHDE